MVGGLTNRYGVAHEQWMWDLKSEPAIVDVFAQIWGTDELLASFGTCNPTEFRPDSQTDAILASR